MAIALRPKLNLALHKISISYQRQVLDIDAVNEMITRSLSSGAASLEELKSKNIFICPSIIYGEHVRFIIGPA